MKYYYKQPKYFAEFKCLGGDCPISCCDGWRVDWTENELTNLEQAEMSSHLYSCIKSSFVKDKNKSIYINLCEDGRCPFHNRENDLCNIQKEIGEKYLGNICRIYPRRYYRRDNVIYRSCTSSCPEVVSFLINDKNSVKYDCFLAQERDNIPLDNCIVDNFEDVKSFTYLKYKPQIFDFYTELFSVENDIKPLIILGGLAAKKISNASDNGMADNIPNIMKEYIKQASNPAIIESIGEINANYRLKYLLVNNMTYDFFGVKKGDIDISALHDGEKLMEEDYLKGSGNFLKAFETYKYAMNNITINLFSDIFLYLIGEKVPFWELYSYFAACMSVLDVFACAVGLKGDNIRENFIKTTSMLSRRISHNVKNMGLVLEYLRNNGITSPAHLALIVK